MSLDLVEGGGDVLPEAEGALRQDLLVRGRERNCELAECCFEAGDTSDEGSATDATGAGGDVGGLVLELPVRLCDEPGTFGVLVKD